MNKRYRTEEEQAFVEGVEVAFDMGLGDEVTSEEVQRYEAIINDTARKVARVSDKTDGKIQKIVLTYYCGYKATFYIGYNNFEELIERLRLLIRSELMSNRQIKKIEFKEGIRL